MRHPLTAKFDTNFADMRQSLGRYGWLADESHGVPYLLLLIGSLIDF
jgi:hypothetical protein